MATAPKKKKLLALDFEDHLEEFWEDCTMLRIVGGIETYKFATQCNRKLGTNFVLSAADCPLSHQKTRNYYYSLYKYHVPGTAISYYLYQNIIDGQLLCKDLKGTDYVWLIKGNISQPDLAALIYNIRQINGVQMAVTVNVASLKNKSVFYL
jgi:hypothetical protein